VSVADGDVAPPRKVGGGNLRAGRFELMNELTRLKIPNLEALGGIPPSRHQEVGNSQGSNSGDLFVITRVQFAEQIALEIPDADLAVTPARQQSATVRREVATGPKAAQTRQGRQLRARVQIQIGRAHV